MLLGGLPPLVRADEPDARPNVLFFAVDDLNDWIGCLGNHPGIKTPNLDRLAARGTLFANAHCAAPACNPSRVALLTGMRPSTTGIYLNSQPWRPHLPDAVTLPQHFMAGGYDVTGCGKIFHGGFRDDASWQDYLKQTNDPKPSDEVLNDPHSRAGGIIWGELNVSDEQMSDYKMASWTIGQLKRELDKPFFLACGIYRPHMPWQVPREYYEMYPLDSIQLPKVKENDLADVPSSGVQIAKPQGDHATILRTDNWRHAVQAYMASITFADAQVGRVLDALDASPHAKNTIIVLWGDHGWHLGEKEHWRKFALWERATKTPLMIVAPGITKPGSVVNQPVDFVNVYPTLCDLCDLPRGEHLEGWSMRPLLEDPKASWDHVALTTHGRNNHAVRDSRWRYIRYADGGEELYDHESDPNEWTNLADDERFAVVKARLQEHLPKTNAKNAPSGEGNQRRRAESR
jgi:arylsulfatase A-like enzyme